jgi:ABC-type transport system involved in multi-copper enzyme maturation permease subunit
MQDLPTRTLLPNAMPHAAINLPQHPTSTNTLRGFLLQMRVIALYEILLQLRSMGYWILLSVLSILTGVITFSQVSTLYTYISDSQAAVAIASNEATFFCCLLPFLFLNVFQRDRQRNVYTLLWTRPLSSFTYALGKSIAAIFLSFLVIWPPLLIGWIVAGISRGSLQPIEPWFILLLINSAAALLVALGSLFCITLVPLPLLGALIPVGISIYLNIVQVKSMVLLTNLTEASLFLSPSINLGPDTGFTVWQRLSYVLGAVLALGLLLLVYQLYQRHGITRLRHYLTTVLLIVLAGTLLISSIDTFQATVANVQDLGTTTVPLSSAQTSQYSLNVQVDPMTGHVQGTASFLLSVPASTTTPFYVAMNPGLQVQQISATSTTRPQSQTLPFTQNHGWTSVNIQQTGLQPAHPITIHIIYAGDITIGRDYYASPIGGFGSGNGVSTGIDYFYLSYLDQGVGMLQGAAGSWYPLPWTVQAVTNDGTRIPIDSLHLRAPSSVSMYNALAAKPTPSADGQWQSINLTPHASLPVALVALLQHPQSTTIDGSTVWYQGLTPDLAEVRSDTSIIQSLNTLNQWLSTTSSHTTIQVVSMPLLTQPFIGQGLLLLPEKPTENASLPLTQSTTNRIAANEIAQAWWLNRTIVPFELDRGDADLQMPYAPSALDPNSNAYAMLSAYSGMVIADKMMGNQFQSREADICQQSYQMDQSASTQSLQDESKIEQALTSIGLPYCTYSELALYHLQQKIGLTKVTSLLQTYATQHAQQAIGTREFLAQASTVAGYNLIPTAAPYICAGRVAVSQGTKDPLACLTNAGQA